MDLYVENFNETFTRFLNVAQVPTGVKEAHTLVGDFFRIGTFNCYILLRSYSL